ncbi:hypothetical protein OIU85_020542 [Salix viminalis]|uniref:Uncharacterized protein n=1 Tax=Salix viminalis TaxID=40686 RepID=A0A9Q0ZCU0_SALVM|nr:hypothetical protein OIU85_020542 [Salix viminalis]
MAPRPALQQGAYHMQHLQAAAMAQQPGISPPKMPLQFNAAHQMQDPQLLHQQGQMGITVEELTFHGMPMNQNQTRGETEAVVVCAEGRDGSLCSLAH